MTKFTLTLFIWLVALLALQPKLLAQVNDPCSGAIAVTCGQTVTGSTSAATVDGPATSCTGFSVAPDVWYTIVGTGGSITASLCTGTSYDSKLDVYTGSCATLVNINGCSDDFCGDDAQMTWASTLGVTYFIRVHGFSGATGNFSLAVTCPVVPANDLCANATPIACGGTATGSTAAANNDGPATDCSGGSTAPDVWYTITGTGGAITASLCGGGTTYDSQLDVYTGACGALVNIGGCSDDFCGAQSQMTWTSILGTVYRIRVHGFSGATGSFSLAVTCAAVFDPCAQTIPVLACNQTVTASATGAGSWSPGSCGFATPGQERLFTFTPAITGNHILNVTAASGGFSDYFFKPVSSGCNATGWTCIDDISAAGSVSFGPLTAGTTYYIMLDPEVTTAVSQSFNLTCPTACPTITNPSTVLPICAGATIPNFTATTSASGTNAISWVRFNTAQTAPNMYAGGTLLGSSTPVAGVATYTPTAANFPVVGNTTTNYFVYAILNPTPTDPACRPFVQIPVTVNPTPTVNSVANQTLCNTQLTQAVNFAGAVPGTTYNWTNSNTSIGLAANGTGNIAAFAAINTSVATVQTATITVTPVFMGCTGTPTSFTITVQPSPQPALTSTITTVSTTQAACPSIMNDVVLDIRVTNTGNIPLTNIQLIENLAAQFGSAFVSLIAAPTVTATTASTTPSLDAGFNGNANPRIFVGSNTAGTTGLLNPGQFVTVRVGIRVNPNENCANPALNNQVTAIGSGAACGSTFNVNQPSTVTPLFVPSLMSSLEMTNFGCGATCANGQTIVAFKAKVKNTGNVPLSGVQITNNLATEMGAAFVNVVPGSLRFAFELSNVATVPTITSAFTGTGGGTNMFSNGALLNPCDELVVVFKATVNPAAGGANLANQFTTTGMFAGTTVSDRSDSGSEPESNNIGASGDTGCANDATVLCLPTIATPAQNLTVDACDTWQSNIQDWLDNQAGAVLNNTCNTVVCVVNDYFDNNNPWVPTANCGLNQTKTVHFTVKYTDINGAMSELCFCANVTVVDNTPPFFDMLPMDKNVDCSTANAASQVQMWLADEGGAWITTCSGSVTVTNNYNGVLPVCNTPRIVVFTATDNCGRSTTASATLTITDNTPPVISGVPANASVTCISNFPPAANVTSTDLCGTSTMTMTEVLQNITSRLSGSQEVPARTTNAAGTFSASVSATGVMTMTVNFSGLTTPVTVAHLHNAAFGSNGPVAVDLIPAVIQSGVTAGNFTGTVQLTAAQIASLKAGELYINIHTSTFPGGEIRGQLGGCARVIRTWTATDACNNTATASQTINVNDAVPPTITNVPANVTLTCPATASFTMPTVADNCGAVAMTFADVTTGGPCPAGSTTIRTWIATDMCGNTATATSSVTIITVTPPPSVVTISCPPNLTVNAPSGTQSTVVTFNAPTATTTCTTGGNITVTQTSGPTSGSSFPAGTTQVCFRATDACGNTATCCFNVTVIGSTVNPPGTTVTINCPANITMTATSGSTSMVVNFPAPTGSTTCTQTGTLNIVQISGPASGSSFPAGTTQVCFRATDACGNTATCCFNVTVIGSTVNPPGSGITITLPPNVTISCGQISNLPLANTTTTCASGGVNVTWVDATVGTSCTGITYTRTYTATDACGNQATAVYTITQLPDTTPPTWTSLPPQDQMINCGDPINYGTAIAADCSAPANVTFTVTNNGATSCNTVNGITYGYDLYVHWVATDLCGNVATANTNIWVLPSNNIAFLSRPADKDMACNDDMIWDQPMPKSYMADIVNIDFEDDYNLDACGSGTVTRTWTATDALGNTCQAQQVQTILPDNEKPGISLPMAYTTVDCNGNLPNIQPTVSDNCTYVDDLVVTMVEHQFGQTIERTYIVTDACGNVNAAILTIGLSDNLAPVFESLPAPQTVSCGTTVQFAQAVAADACEVASLTYADQVQTSTCEEVHTRTWTAIDANGNMSQAQQTIKIVDQEAPAFSTAPSDKTVVCASDILFDQPTATDACGTVALYFNDVQTTPSCGASGYTVTRTWTANDGCNNLAQIAQVITVAQDQTAPVIATQFPTITEITTAQALNWQPETIIVSDDCNTVVVAHQITPIDVCNFSVQYTATDACGNLSTIDQLVRIIDGACVVLSSDDLAAELGMEVYPNPAGGALTLNLKGAALAGEYQCEIFDMLGKRVMQRTISQAQTQLDLTNMVSGTYWLKLTNGTRHGAVKFVKIAH